MGNFKSFNVKKVYLGSNYLNLLTKKIEKIKKNNKKILIILIVDKYLKNSKLINDLSFVEKTIIYYIDNKYELSTEYVDNLTSRILNLGQPKILIGIGGGTTLDCTKAVSVLLTNPQKASNYQGWNLIINKGIYKIGIPTISGTGAESSRTCVLLNKKNKLKLGFNSKFTIFDEVYLLPDLLKSVPKKLFFITGMDAFFHSFELLNGRKRVKISDDLAKKTLNLCNKIFTNKPLKSQSNFTDIMKASFMGGEAISKSMVGLVHPFSAGLSSILGIKHCLANCIAFRGLKEFYPNEYEIYKNYLDINGIRIPKINLKNCTNSKLTNVYNSVIMHEKPLKNALGINYKIILNKKKIFEILRKM